MGWILADIKVWVGVLVSLIFLIVLVGETHTMLKELKIRLEVFAIVYILCGYVGMYFLGGVMVEEKGNLYVELFKLLTESLPEFILTSAILVVFYTMFAMIPLLVVIAFYMYFNRSKFSGEDEVE